MTNRIIRFAIILAQSAVWLVVTAGLSAADETVLTPHSAEYRVKISVLGGRLRTELSATNTGYAATHVIKATGMSRIVARGTITESSRFAIARDGIRPTRYFSEDTLTRDKTKADLSFDWDKGEARGTVNGEEVLSELEDLAFDRVSIQYQLMYDLLNGGPDSQYTMFEVDKLRTVNVRTIGHKQVKVPAGVFDAIGIQHQSENSSRTMTMWCVEELDFLPVIIEQRRKGKLRVRAVLRNYTPSEVSLTDTSGQRN